MLWSRSREAEIKCHPEPELKIRIAAPAPLNIYHKLEDILKQKIMVAKEVFARVTILTLYLSKKGSFQGIL